MWLQIDSFVNEQRVLPRGAGCFAGSLSATGRHGFVADKAAMTTTSSLAVHAGNTHTHSTYEITALTRSMAFLPAFVSAAMTKWCVVASKLVSEQDRNFAVRCSTVWSITLVEGCRRNLRRRGGHVRRAKSGKASPADNKHTHWTRRIPDRALVSAFESANTNRTNPVFVVHLFSCVFACQAHLRPRLSLCWA